MQFGPNDYEIQSLPVVTFICNIWSSYGCLVQYQCGYSHGQHVPQVVSHFEHVMIKMFQHILLCLLNTWFFWCPF